MSQKPLKRNIHIVELSKDHHFTLLFCWKIRQGLKRGADPERIRNYVAYFREQHMREHFREEEELLFSAVKDEQVDKAWEDHRQINRLADQVVEKPTAENLQQLADMVDDHVRYEERTLFPHLEQVLTEEQLEKIGKAITEQKEPVADDYEDAFWLSER